MTDEEFTELEAALDYKELSGVKTLLFPPKLPCDCRGPGSDKQLYSSHTGLCPQYFSSSTAVDTKYGGLYKKNTCRHNRDLFQLEDNLSIFASSYSDVDLLEDGRVDLGIYFYNQWTPDIVAWGGISAPWFPEHTTKGIYVSWPDYGIPSDETPVRDMVDWVLEQTKAGVQIETACMGGHGRTGTMLALLLVAQGLTPPAAVARVRENHCTEAIEGKKQLEYISSFYTDYHGNSRWRKSKSLRRQFEKLVSVKTASGGYYEYSGSAAGSRKPGYVWDDSQKKHVPPK